MAGLAEGEHEVATLGERERFTIEIGQGNVGGQPERAREALISDVIGTGERRWLLFRPTEPRRAANAYQWSSIEWLDDAEELSRAEQSSRDHETWRKVQDAKATHRRLEGGFEHVGVVEIALLAVDWIGRADQEFAAAFLVEERRK